MRSISRHFIATLVCVTIFTLFGTIDGFFRVLQTMPNPNPGASLLFTGFLNFVMVFALSLVVLTPVTSIADYLFKYKWPFSVFIQIPLLIPLLVLYLLPWTLFFGRFFFIVLLSGAVALTLPLMVYWCVFRALDREFFT
jgi:hypothetical protein